MAVPAPFVLTNFGLVIVVSSSPMSGSLPGHPRRAAAGTVAGVLKLGRGDLRRHRLLMMAIVNRTRDSFYDRGATWAEDRRSSGSRRWSTRAPRSSTSAASRPAPARTSTSRRRSGAWCRFVGAGARGVPRPGRSASTPGAPRSAGRCARPAPTCSTTPGAAPTRELVDVAAEHGAAIVCTHTGGATPRTRRTGVVRRRGGRRDRGHRRARRARAWRRGATGAAS